MIFDSYISSGTKTAQSVPLQCRYSNMNLTIFDKLKRKKFKGFTLAETLITLAIIGVIAALTIPTLISKYQDLVITTKLKKAQSILANALSMTRTENPDWYLSSADGHADTNVINAKLLFSKIKHNQEGRLFMNAHYNIITDEPIIYGYHDNSYDYQDHTIHVIIPKSIPSSLKEPTEDSLFEIEKGHIFSFDVISNRKIIPSGAPGSYTPLTEQTVCPSTNLWQSNPCTYWTLNTGKINKKAGEWDSRVATPGEPGVPDDDPAYGYH